MKQMLLLLLVAGFVLPACAQKQRASPHDTLSNANIKVTYGRPYKKGREIFGGLEKYGKVWRTGADEATEITFKKDGTFAGKPVKAGTYTLFTIPNEQEWTVILNSELKQWGAFGYDKVKSKDVLTATVPAKTLLNVVEQLTMRFEGNDLVIEWDKAQIMIPFQF
jgi:Protein of unknown function (DUF2911)